MKILVTYASRHGATRGIAERIAATIERHDIPVALREIRDVDSIDAYSAFVIGSSAYMGHWERDAAAFVRHFADHLLEHPVWLFSSGPVGTEKVDKNGRDVLELSRPQEFADFQDLILPREARVFFGAYDPFRKDATFAEKLVVKMPAIRDLLPAGDFRDWDAIEAWATDIARELQPVVAAP